MEAGTIALISLVLSAASAIYAMTLNLDTDDQDDNGSTINKSGTSASRNPVYGTCRTGAVPVYNNVSDASQSQLLNVFACGIGVTHVKQIYIDDVQVLTDDGMYRESGTNINQLRFSGSSLANGFEKQCEVQIRAGLDTGIPLGLAVEFGDGEFTTDFRGDRVCAMAIKSQRIIDDQGIRIMSDNFEVNLLVDGLPLYDPRFNTEPSEKQFEHGNSVPAGNRECGRNPALAALDYLTDDYYGMAIPFEYINVESFGECANWCDSNGFRIDGQIDSSGAFSKALKGIVDCAGLILTIENGQIHCHYEDAVLAPSASFDHDNIINGSLSVEEANSSSYYNVIEVEYKNSELNDDQDVYTIPANTQTDPTIANDGFINSSTLSLPFVRMSGSESNSIDSQVKKLANRELKRGQFLRKVSFDTDLWENPVQIYDVIAVSDENLGWGPTETNPSNPPKLFRITDINKSLSDEQGISIATLSCVEYDDSVYSGTIDGTDPSKPVPKPNISAPVGLSFDLYDYVTDGYGTFSWKRTWFETECDYIVDYKRTNDVGWTRLGRTKDTEWKVSRLQPDSYDFRVATNSNLYGTSDFNALTGIVISPLGTLPDVTGATAEFSGVNCELFWDDMLGEPVTGYPDSPESGKRVVGDIFSHYRVSIFDDGNDLLRVIQASTNEYLYTYQQNIVDGTNRTIRAEIEIVSLDGTSSLVDPTTSAVTVTNPQCVQPTIRYENTALSTTVIEWDPPPELNDDYRITKIYSSTDSGFTPIDAPPPTGNLIAEQVGTVFTRVWDDEDNHYIRLAHVDVFDNSNQKYTGEILAKPSQIELPIDNRFAEIRNPDGAQGPEQVLKAADGSFVSAIGLFADEETEDTTVLIAAEKVLFGVGGRPYWSSSESYSVGDRVLFVWGSDPITDTGYFEALKASVNVPPTLNGNANWRMYQSNVNQSVFAVQDDGRVLIRNAVIEDLNGGKITVGTLHGDRIIANTIQGNQISSATTIIAGSGSSQAGMNGDDVTNAAYSGWRFWAGSSTPSAAPFRVTYSGATYMTNATITGGSLNVNGKFIVQSNGTTTIKSASSGSRLVMSGDRLEVYEGSTLRVRIGRL